MDTEGLPGSPWGLSYSATHGDAHVVRAGDREALDTIRSFLSAPTVHVILHNALHDLAVLRDMNILLRQGSYTDTIVMAYLLCIEPQGLKPLAFRHAGMVMSSYPEVIRDADRRI